ncbi:hypothetical protein RvVAR0630_16040 [Agrobacterium vitis]|uniref:hypothetical protein n=1 Tax=Agrobacterium vitis TaxID=373 RepID=UPI0015D934C7|nr:hypothetical protein [Agrobacterium vitis]BCH58980.1 hypothetical protein RvVAR0630_16040 [Agrobacterium vitis]
MNKLIKSFIASTAIGHQVQVKAGANDGEVALATASTDNIIGVTDYPGGAVIGERIDVVLLGETEIQVGGTITFGAFFTADANGKAVAAAPAAGVNARTGGILTVSAVLGDIARVLVTPNRIQG